MEANSWMLAQVEVSAADATSGDWPLQRELRQWMVDTIMDILKKCLRISMPEGLNELRKIAVRFEEKVYTRATSEADYLSKIARKIVPMQYPSMRNTAVPNQNPTEPAARQQLLPENFQNNTRAAGQSSANLPSALSSITGLGQSNISQSMPGISQPQDQQQFQVSQLQQHDNHPNQVQ